MRSYEPPSRSPRLYLGNFSGPSARLHRVNRRVCVRFRCVLHRDNVHSAGRRHRSSTREPNRPVAPIQLVSLHGAAADEHRMAIGRPNAPVSGCALPTGADGDGGVRSRNSAQPPSRNVPRRHARVLRRPGHGNAEDPGLPRHVRALRISQNDEWTPFRASAAMRRAEARSGKA